MVFGSFVVSPLGSLSPQQALVLANVYLDNAWNINDTDIALVLCHDTEVSLSRAKKAAKHFENQIVIGDIADAYASLGKLLEERGHGGGAQASYKKATKLGWTQDRHAMFSAPTNTARSLDAISPHAGSQDVSESTPHPPQNKRHDIVTIPTHIFVENIRPPAVEFKLPEAYGRLSNTQQLVYCLSLLQVSHSTDNVLEPGVHRWLQATLMDTEEQERLNTMAMEVIRVFKRDELKDAKTVAEVVCLSPVLNKDAFHGLLSEFYSGIDHSGLLNLHQLDGLAQLIQGADPGHLSADDLIKILDLLSKRLRDTHQQSTHHLCQLTIAVSHVLDAMADTKVIGLDRETLHEPLSAYLKELKGRSDAYLVFQAAYAYQALLCVPDNETAWQAAMRRTGKVVLGVAGLASAVKGLDLIKFIEGLEDIQKGIGGASTVVRVAKTAYDGVSTLASSGQGFMESLKEGLSFDRKRDWYSALRGADVMIRNGELATFRKLVCEAPCRLDPAFQWGVCQRLGEIAANPSWDVLTRRSAVEFLGEIYQNDTSWGQQASIKQWIINILVQLASSGMRLEFADALLLELEAVGDDKKKALYRECLKQGPTSYPLKLTLSETGSQSLLDRVQNRPDVEGNLRLMKKQRTKERGSAVYIPPQAKASFQAADDARFPLMEKVKEFLNSEQKVFLLLGDSGAGKSAFSRELEFELWQMYKTKTGRVPLHINLPAIDKPEHDLIAKQLRRDEFTEPQIRELKHHRKFILICDGYDESQQAHNLYMSNRLNESGEWDAQMVVSCRSEYLGLDYRDRFQPAERNRISESSLLQEAVIAPFSLDQVQSYIHQYVSIYQPMWQTKDYKQALELIPSLGELVKNPFLMTLSLDVLPRMVDPGQHLSASRITRVGLYDHFVEQWLERGKKRLGEKELSPQARDEFEKLSDEGFILNGIEYLKTLAVAIYKEQSGHPIVEYSTLVDEGSWKAEFFSRKDKQLLREACPLTRNGNQHRFIHRSLLEYGLARAVFDPQGRKDRTSSNPRLGRRGSASSILSMESQDIPYQEDSISPQAPDPNSPLVWRSIVGDHSLIQFLEERVLQEQAFKDQLLSYIECSKTDKKWRKAAANAITILVRAGVQFINTDLRGIQIPGADISYGVFDSVQLQNANLRKVKLRGVWMRQTNLSGAQMTGAQFGEMPFLTEVDNVLTCAYSPDGKSFVIGLGNGDIIMYATSNWEKTRTWKAHPRGLLCVEFSPKGDWIASSGNGSEVWLWNSETEVGERTFDAHTGFVSCVTFSPQGDQLAFGGADPIFGVWDVTTSECRQTFAGHTGAIMCVVFSPNGNQIASCSEDCTIRLWSVETGACGQVLLGHDNHVWSVAYSPQGDQIASASEDTTIRLWDVETGICHHVIDDHSDIVCDIVYSPNGDQIASGSKDGTLRLWDPETGACRYTLTGHVDSISCVAYSPKGDQILTSSLDSTARLWDVSVGVSRFVSLGHSAEISGVKCSPSEGLIVSGSTDRTIRLWDAGSGTCRRTLAGHGCGIFTVAYSPQGDTIASGDEIDSVQVWDLETGALLHVFNGHSDSVNCVTYSPQGDVVASASNDCTVILWNLQSGEYSGILEGHTDTVLSVTYSPDGSRIATAGMDMTIRIWDVESKICAQVLEGHTFWVRDVVYSPLGDRLASAGYDNTVRLWNLDIAECRLTLNGHNDRVSCVAFSPQGDVLASGSWDKTVRLWDVASGECRAEIQNFQDILKCISWGGTQDTGYLITGCGNGSLLKWEIIKEGDQYHACLNWSATNGALCVIGANVQGVRGLTSSNKQLLNQRGAVGEPEHLLRETSKKVVTMASVVSNLKMTDRAT